MLPSDHAGQYHSNALQKYVPEFLRRATQIDQMELDSALSQMIQTVMQPSKVAWVARARKVSKGYFYRDDPAFMALQILVLVVVNVAYGMTLDMHAMIPNIMSSIIFNYLGFGIIIASVTRALAVAVLRGAGGGAGSRGAAVSSSSSGAHEGGSSSTTFHNIEWRYAFDIHCNAFCAYYFFAGVVQFALLPILLSTSFFARLLSNALYTVAIGAYCYNTFRGYLEIPGLKQQELLLYPVGAVGVVLLMLTVFSHFSVSTKNIFAEQQLHISTCISSTHGAPVFVSFHIFPFLLLI